MKKQMPHTQNTIAAKIANVPNYRKEIFETTHMIIK
jgi:hypothetical protein